MAAWRKPSPKLWLTLALVVILGIAGYLVIRPQQVPSVPDSPFYATTDNNAAKDAASAKAEGADAARYVELLARTPTATWFTGGQDVAGARDAAFNRADAITAQAQAAGKTPLFVLYDIPGRDCGQFSAGGSEADEDYYAYVGALGAGIGDRKAWVVIEPDAIAHAIEGCGDVVAEERYRQISTAIDILSKQPGVTLYVDAGNSDWIDDQDALAEALKKSGIDKTAGFALNVSNFQTTEASLVYGRDLSGRLDGAHYVIDTSRNGKGPDGNQWCNPTGRSIGAFPTTETGDDLVDAYLWVKVPGDSDGTCNGGPAAGTWWRDYAVGLVKERPAS